MAIEGVETEDLIELAGRGDGAGLGRLLERHRSRLRRVVAARLDRRLAGRVDPSDVVQEALVDAARRLPEYLEARPIPYFAWLRRLALQRLIGWRRSQLDASKRSVVREGAHELGSAGATAATPIDRLAGTATSPSGRVIRDEEGARARAALEGLAPQDRQVLELRFLEGLPLAEVSARLEIGVGAVKMRQLRALERFRERFEGAGEGPGS
jgi:RNA polymerase sigma-70 factor (ECF subfamily)